jgi:hypothetical protein
MQYFKIPFQTVISVIGAGGDCSFASVTDRKSLTYPIDQRKLAQSTQIEQLTASMVDEVRDHP